MVTVTVTVPGAAPVSGWQPLPPPRGRLSGQLETGVRTLGQAWSHDYRRHSPGLTSTLPNADSPGLTSTLPDAKMLSTGANGQKAPRSFAKLIELSCMLSIRGLFWKPTAILLYYRTSWHINVLDVVRGVPVGDAMGGKLGAINPFV